MTDPLSAAAPRGNVPEYTVSELSNALKRTVETTYDQVRVRGEISGFKRHSSGHLYFALKDAEAVMDAVCWRGQATRLGINPEDGMEVIATGRLTTYPGRSKYQMVVERMELAGQGALLKLLEDRRKKLAGEGLFEPARKKAIPFLPGLIGVITSPTGAVIRDILHRLGDRFPSRVLLWPVAVQGTGAAEQVAAAIRGFNALSADGPIPRPDVLIVARGGGSLEDLWAFNEEIVVRAAAASDIPLISAVGHETDTTLIDFASDLRAPTPTGAAEMAVPVRRDLVAQVSALSGRLGNAAQRLLDEHRTRIEGLARGLPNPRRVLEDCTQRLDDRAERLLNAMPNLLHRRRAEMQRLAARLPSPRERIAEARHRLERLGQGLDHGARTLLTERAGRLGRTAAGLRWKPIADEIARGTREIERLALRLPGSIHRVLVDRDVSLDRFGGLLESYSYKNVLQRGYAVVRDVHGQVVSHQTAPAGAALTIEFLDGATPVTVTGQAPRKARGKKSDQRQGSLL